MNGEKTRAGGRWLLLIHQIPPKPAYLRVRIGRRLARVGAVALKNTVYVLPRSEGALEHFQWVLGEVSTAGGEAALLAADTVDGLSDTEIERLFRAARDADYAAVAKEARELERKLGRRKLDDEQRRELEPLLQRLERKVEEIAAIDFFEAAGQLVTEGLLAALRVRLTPKPTAKGASKPNKPEHYRGRTWVTRADVHVDRIASAWLIRRFIDPKATFKLVAAKGYVPEPGELRFDMFEAEFSHEGDQCTFEVLCARMQLDAPGLPVLAEIVHDIDLKDGMFERPETAGVAAMISGLVPLHEHDEARIAHGSELLDALLAHFSRKKGA